MEGGRRRGESSSAEGIIIPLCPVQEPPPRSPASPPPPVELYLILSPFRRLKSTLTAAFQCPLGDMDRKGEHPPKLQYTF